MNTERISSDSIKVVNSGDYIVKFIDFLNYYSDVNNMKVMSPLISSLLLGIGSGIIFVIFALISYDRNLLRISIYFIIAFIITFICGFLMMKINYSSEVDKLNYKKAFIDDIKNGETNIMISRHYYQRSNIYWISFETKNGYLCHFTVELDNTMNNNEIVIDLSKEKVKCNDSTYKSFEIEDWFN